MNFEILLATIFANKSKKWYPKKHPKIDDLKLMATGSQNDEQMDAQIEDLSCFFEKGENARNHCIYKLKRGSGLVKSNEKSVLN